MNKKQVDTLRTAWLFILIGLAVAIPLKFILNAITMFELSIVFLIFGAGFVLVFGKDCWIESTEKKKSDFYMMNGKLKRFE